jgi:hypothetical protein
MTMLAPHLSKGHTLYVDNWYSSPTLFQHLLSTSTGACGTVRSNRKGMPALGCRKMNGQQLAVKLHDKRDIHVLSTVHTATMSATGKVDHLTVEKKKSNQTACLTITSKWGSGYSRHDKKLCGMHSENDQVV